MSMNYADLYRKNYEVKAISVWMVSIPIAYLVMQRSTLPSQPFLIMIFFALVMASGHVTGAWRIFKNFKNLRGFPMEFYTTKKLKKILQKNKGKIYLGRGFMWTQKHTQAAHEILRQDISNVLPAEMIEQRDGAMGWPFIHGLEDKSKEIPIFQEISHQSLHTMAIGSTGSGKTAYMKTALVQAIWRPNNATFLFDPKLDWDLVETMSHEAAAVGKAFYMVHPNFPEKSIRIDPLYNFNSPTEIASRIAEAVPAGKDPTYRSFGFAAINNVVQGLLLNNERPTLKKIRQYLEGGPDQLVVDAVSIYFDHVVPDWERDHKREMSRLPTTKDRADWIYHFYHEHVKREHPNSDVAGLLQLYHADFTHFSKMIASTLPLLVSLTSGDIGYMLSPDATDEDDRRFITDTARIINQSAVVYIGLPALSDPSVSEAIGKIFLADMASIAGARNSFGVKDNTVSLFIDEAASAMCDSLIQLLNKSRSSGLSIFLCTQSIIDYAAQMGDEAKANMFLANINNLVVLRIIDNESQQYVCENLPKTTISSLMRGQGNNTDSGNALLHGGSSQERITQEEADLFPAALLGSLPNLEYLAKLSGGRIIKGRIPVLKIEDNQ